MHKILSIILLCIFCAHQSTQSIVPFFLDKRITRQIPVGDVKNGSITISAETLKEANITIKAANITQDKIKYNKDGSIIITEGAIKGGAIIVQAAAVIGASVTITQKTNSNPAGQKRRIPIGNIRDAEIVLSSNSLTKGTIMIDSAITIRGQNLRGSDGSIIITGGTITSGAISISAENINGVNMTITQRVQGNFQRKTREIPIDNLQDGIIEISSENMQNTTITVKAATITGGKPQYGIDGSITITGGTIQDGFITVIGQTISDVVLNVIQKGAGNKNGNKRTPLGNIKEGVVNITARNISVGTIYIKSGTNQNGDTQGGKDGSITITGQIITQGFIRVSGKDIIGAKIVIQEQLPKQLPNPEPSVAVPTNPTPLVQPTPLSPPRTPQPSLEQLYALYAQFKALRASLNKQ